LLRRLARRDELLIGGDARRDGQRGVGLGVQVTLANPHGEAPDEWSRLWRSGPARYAASGVKSCHFFFNHTTSIQPFCISSQVCRPQRTSALGSGLRGLSAELSQWPVHVSFVPLGIASGFSKR